MAEAFDRFLMSFYTTTESEIQFFRNLRKNLFLNGFMIARFDFQ